MKKRVLLLTLALPGTMALGLSGQGSPALAAEAELTCSAERAIYQLESEYGAFRAEFVRSHFASIASDLYLRITSPQRPYWFKFSVSNGYSQIGAMPIADPYAEAAREDGPRELLAEAFDDPDRMEEAREILSNLTFYPMASDLTVFASPPNSGENAPAYFFMPQMGLTLWYAPRAISEDATAMRDPMPVGMFKLTECRDAPLPEAFP